jgi:hypothetical protein
VLPKAAALRPIRNLTRNQKMKRKIASLGWVACLIYVAGTAAASGREARWQSLEGAWRVDVTPRACDNGQPAGQPIAPAFPTLNTYHFGGTLSEHGSALPPSQRGSGHGIWKRVGASAFTYRLTFQIFDVSGLLTATQNVASTLVVGAGGDTLTGTSTFTRTDASGNVSPLRCATLTGTRIKF